MRTDLVEKFSDVRILVVGDCVYDIWIEGTADRLSPEAPVPVFVKTRTWDTPGGAGNMARNAESLGCVVYKQYFSRSNRNYPPTWPSRVRYMVDGHQLLRVDNNDHLTLPITQELEADYANRVREEAKNVDVIAISDYGHGAVMRSVVEAAINSGKRVVVDPARNAPVSLYEGVSVIKPNRKEMHRLTPGRPDDGSPLTHISYKTGASVVATLGQDGMRVLERVNGGTNNWFDIPGHPVPVADVTGAGDTAMAALCAMLGAGATLTEAAEVANLAASLSVQRPGTATVSADELMKAFEAL